jgi:hypothetical protein
MADRIQQLLKIVEAVLLRTLLLDVILRCTFEYQLELSSGCFPGQRVHLLPQGKLHSALTIQVYRWA